MSDTNFMSYNNAHEILTEYADKINNKVEAIISLPTPSETYNNKVYLYNGNTTSNYTKGALYQCQQNGSNYSWILINNPSIINENIICPDDYGAKGNGTTDDSSAFLSGDYIYQLTEGKVYLIANKDVYKRICANNSVIGKGIIKGQWTHGVQYETFEKRADSYSNRLVECVNHYAKENTYASVSSPDGLGRRLKEQCGTSAIRPTVAGGYYHNIGAIYYDYDKVDLLPDTFTICIGRSVVFQKRDDESKWIKTIDMPYVDPGQIKNYALPWTPQYARSFDHSPEIVDDHIELQINKTELTTWSGSQSGKIGGCIHFWSDNYSYQIDEYDHLIIYWEVWVKDPKINDVLQFSPALDNMYTDGGTTNKVHQAIISAGMPLRDYKQSYWNCTMNAEKAKEVNYNELVSSLLYNNICNYTLDSGRNFNILGLEDFSLSSNGRSLSYNGDYFNFNVDSPTSTSNINLTSYLKKMPDLKAGDTVRFNMELLGSQKSWTWQGTFQYANGGSFSISSGYEVISSTIRSKIQTLTKDMDRLNFYSTTSIAYAPQFRIWITKGEKYYPYQKYGADIPGYLLNEQVIDKYLEDRIKKLEQTTFDTSNFIQQVTTLPTPSSDLEFKMYRYMGDDDDTYTPGFLYTCMEANIGQYIWTPLQVNPAPIPTDFYFPADYYAPNYNIIWTGNAEVHDEITFVKGGIYSIQKVNNQLKWTELYKPEFITKTQNAVVIGDSFFDGSHFPQGTQYNFGEYLENEGIYNTVYNFGRAGSGFGKNDSNIKLSAMLQETEVINAIQNSDVMYLHMGGNDLVTASGVTGLTAETNILDVVRSELNTIYSINPNIKIYFIPATDVNDLLIDVWIPAVANQDGMLGTIITEKALAVLATQYQIDLAMAASSLDIMRFHIPISHLITERRTNDIHPTKKAAELMFHEIIYGDYERAFLTASIDDTTNIFIPSSENTWIKNALTNLAKESTNAYSEYSTPLYAFFPTGSEIVLIVANNRTYFANNLVIVSYDYQQKKFVAMTKDPSTGEVDTETYPLNIQEVVAASNDFADFKARMAAL